MDFDSSSKFISSLAKFLQSLCNGYVEFNNGVEVIGHIYLNVDTGKKIDYILNEKVCKTDENSVTFISNSFHAQPAEKPKPPGKNATASDPIKPADSNAKGDEEDIIIMEEPESKNVGTVPSRDSFQHSASPHPKSGRPSKRSYNQSFPSSHKHLSKQSRSDHPSLQIGPNGAPQDTDSLHSESNSSSNFLSSQITSDTTLTAASESDMTHLSKVFPQNLDDSTNNQSAAEERDIKPQLDSDMNIVHVKQEYDPSDQGGEDDQESFDDSQDQGSVFPGMPYDQYYGDGTRRGQRSDYNQMGGMAQGEYFQGGAGPSGEAGDSSDQRLIFVAPLWKPGSGCPVQQCPAKDSCFNAKAYFTRHWNEKHEIEVVHHKCPLCSLTTKRRDYIPKHAWAAHGVNIDSTERLQVMKHNREFLDPAPITLAMCVRGDVDCMPPP